MSRPMYQLLSTNPFHLPGDPGRHAVNYEARVPILDAAERDPGLNTVTTTTTIKQQQQSNHNQLNAAAKVTAVTVMISDDDGGGDGNCNIEGDSGRWRWR